MNRSVGVIGAGQLARMMIPEAQALGIDLKILAEASGSSAALAVTAIGRPDDTVAVLDFARTVDIVTFEHELVPQGVLSDLDKCRVAVLPRPAALQYAQNKIALRRLLDNLGIDQPVWTEVQFPQELQCFIAEHGGCAVVKTKGYDGHGVRVVTQPSEVENWFSWVFLAEEKVDFACEVSQIIARSPSGEMRAWPLTQTIQENGVCVSTITPLPPTLPLSLNSGKLQIAAQNIAFRIAEELEVVGVMAVEMFLTRDKKLLVNELALRPHNSGHWTQAASNTNQFEQHLRAVLDLPLGATHMSHNWAIMVNIFGAISCMQYRQIMKQWPSAKLNIYNKEPRAGRKLGHVIFVGEDFEQVVRYAEQCKTLLSVHSGTESKYEK